MTFKNFIKGLNGEGVEGDLIKTIFISLISSFLILVIFYFLVLKNIEEIIPKYGFYLFFSILGYSLLISSINYVRAYREFACMSGMMIGMTMGMIAGFISGFYVGSTNGMFWGSVFGIIIGIFFGIENGKCCGIMGIMEGIMAGFMGGLMGAMTAIMMFNDNLLSFGVIAFIISAVILVGLNFMIYKETKEREREKESDPFFVVFWSILLTTLTVWIMVFGPRSLLFQ